MERSIQTVKKILYKCEESGPDPYIGLLQHRTTPKAKLPSPAELLMSRNLRTKLPSVASSFKPKIVDEKLYEVQLNKKILKSAEHYNKNAIHKKSTNRSGENILFKRNPNTLWSQGQIVQRCEEPRSFVLRDSELVHFRRNEQHILSKPEPLDIKAMKMMTFQTDLQVMTLNL